jgi:hypothetical protein
MMSIRIADDLAVWWPIKVSVPRDGGKPEQVTIEIKFRIAKISDAASKTAREMLLEDVLDWRGIEDEFSRENLERALDYAFWWEALELGLTECSKGAPAKN